MNFTQIVVLLSFLNVGSASAMMVEGDAPVAERVDITQLNDRLLVAARDGNDPLVTELLAQGADVNHTDSQGASALTWAAHRGHVQVINSLLAARADVNHIDNEGRTALILAALRGHVQVINSLLAARADVNHVDHQDMTVLMCAAFSGRSEAVGSLLAAGAELNHADSQGRTALTWATQKGWAGVVALLTRAAAYPLHFAAETGAVARVSRLMTKGEDLGAEDDQGRTAYAVAAPAVKTALKRDYIGLLRAMRRRGVGMDVIGVFAEHLGLGPVHEDCRAARLAAAAGTLQPQ